MNKYPWTMYDFDDCIKMGSGRFIKIYSEVCFSSSKNWNCGEIRQIETFKNFGFRGTNLKILR